MEAHVVIMLSAQCELPRLVSTVLRAHVRIRFLLLFDAPCEWAAAARGDSSLRPLLFRVRRLQLGRWFRFMLL